MNNTEQIIAKILRFYANLQVAYNLHRYESVGVDDVECPQHTRVNSEGENYHAKIVLFFSYYKLNAIDNLDAIYGCKKTC